MTYDNDPRFPLDIGGVDFAEHSKLSRAKKVIPGPIIIAYDSVNKRTLAPINSVPAPLGSISLVRNKAYRMISDGDTHFLLTNDNTDVASAVAASADTYLPTDTPIIIVSRGFQYLKYTSTGSFVQLTEVQ